MTCPFLPAPDLIRNLGGSAMGPGSRAGARPAETPGQRSEGSN